MSIPAPNIPAAGPSATITITGNVQYQMNVSAIYLINGYQVDCGGQIAAVTVDASSGQSQEGTVFGATESSSRDAQGDGVWLCQQSYRVTLPRAASYIAIWTYPQMPRLNAGCHDNKNTGEQAESDAGPSLAMPLMSWEMTCYDSGM